MAYQTILYEKAGRIARIVLNRPERLNAISLDLPDELERAVAEANADGDVRAIILKGAG
ncbi:MAG: enoyl-CoA hydratase, partial [Dehalococcoidia bacterium SM23_28_2]